ncbi:hypothetical protein O5D80_006125 [Batrachochytrium dendrobatidis]|nr:hypothetical protein O5D80_006125 [Batrachochytrium dendrobatidis]
MDLRLMTLVDMGLTLTEAVASLNQANGVIERAVELHFSGHVRPSPLKLKPIDSKSTTKQAEQSQRVAYQSKWLGFGSNISSPSAHILESITEQDVAKARDFQMAKETFYTNPSISQRLFQENSMIVPPIPQNPHERIRIASMPVGLHGLVGMSPLRCITQALYHFPPVRQVIFEAGLFDSWGAVSDQYDPALDKTSACSLLMEVEKLFSGLALSKRSFKSSLCVEKAFIAYRRLMNLELSKDISDTWAYFLHALGAEVHSLRRMTHIQVHQDEPTQTGESLTPCINVHPELDLYTSLDKVLGLSPNPSVVRAYIFSRDEMINSGRIMSLNFRSPAENQSGCVTAHTRLFIDRYLGRNFDFVSGLVRQRVSYALELESCRHQLDKYSQNELDIIKITVEFLKSQSDLGSEELIANMEGIHESILQTVLKLQSKIKVLENNIANVFNIPELQRMPFDIYAIFVLDNSKTVVYIRRFLTKTCLETNPDSCNTTWTRFADADTTLVSNEHIHTLKNITAIWYTYGVTYTDDINETSSVVPESLKSFVQIDNNAFDVELQEWTRSHETSFVSLNPTIRTGRESNPKLADISTLMDE